MTAAMEPGHLTRHPMRPADGAAGQGGSWPVARPATADEMLAAALAYAAGGWPVFPCEVGGKRPVAMHGYLSAVTEEDIARDRWRKPFNIGASTGRVGAPADGRGFDVLDVDVRANGDGWAAFGKLKQAGLLTGAHQLVRTPGGGCHLYFAGTDQRCGSLPAHHIDFKACGGYVLVPPSVVGGRPYEVIDQRQADGRLDWEACKRLLSPPRPGPARVWVGRGGSVKHLPHWLGEQPEGNRNSALFWAVCRATECRDERVVNELITAAISSGLDEAEAVRTAASAVRKVVDGGR